MTHGTCIGPLTPTYLLDYDRQYSLFTPGQVSLASLLGGPLAGFWLLAVNFRRRAEAAAAVFSLMGGVVVSALLLAIVCSAVGQVPAKYSLLALAATAYAMCLVADSLQGAEVKFHKRAGGETASAWTACAAGLIVAAAQLPVLLTVVALAG